MQERVKFLMKKNGFRHQGIDALRIIAAFAVVCLHTNPFKYAAESYGSPFFAEIFFVTEKMFKFAVPCFFLTSGYFFSLGVRSGVSVKSLWGKSVRRIALIYCSWTLFYAFLTPNLMKYILEYGPLNAFKGAFLWDTVEAFKEEPVKFLLEGSAVHLWFLVALFISVSLLSLCLLLRMEKWILPIAGVLYLVGLLLGAYSTTPLGIQTELFEARHGPFFGFLFLALGWRLSSVSWGEGNKAVLLCVVALSCFAQIGEAYLIRAHLNVSGFDFSFATVGYGLSIFLFALSFPVLRRLHFLCTTAQYSLGIYTLHVFVWNLIYAFRDRVHPIAWDATATVFVFLMSLFCVKILSRVPILKRVIF